MSTTPPPTEARPDQLWGQLHALSVIAQLGSFTKAAQRLGLSTPQLHDPL